jgi:hypothetical protein
MWLRLLKAIALDKLGTIRRLRRSKKTASGALGGALYQMQLVEFFGGTHHEVLDQARSS